MLMLRLASLMILTATALACTIAQPVRSPTDDVVAESAAPATQESLVVRLDERRDPQ
jgi:hypothetical protein